MSDINITASEKNTLTTKGYKLIKFVGEGAYAKVYLSEYTAKEDLRKAFLACKIIETQNAPQDFVLKFLPREIDVLIRLNHPHMVHVHSIFQRKTKFYIFMRYTENGDLLGYILRNGNVSENQARVWTRQLALALQYIHELEIAHRDIKCQNVLLTANYNVKLSDFGFARFCVDDKNSPILSETYCGSMSYAAPEILRGKPYSPKPTDIWSLGVVLYVMLNKSMPFDDTQMRRLYEQQMSKKYRFRSRIASIISLECKALVKHLLEPDPVIRFTAGQILRSDWISMDSRLTTLNAVEAAALKRAKEDRRKLSNTQSSSNKKSNEITYDDSTSRQRMSDREPQVKLTKSEILSLESRGYKIVKKINEGAFAKVYCSEYKQSQKDESYLLACKVMDITLTPKEFVNKFLPREIDALIRLKHPYLVHTHSIFLRRNKYFIFMRYMESGDLLEYILRKGVVPEDQARLWLRQLSLAVQYMHILELAHRDIKCENVLLTANKNAKLSDFGFCRECVNKDGKHLQSSTFCGSLSYTAPEIVSGKHYLPKPTDIWSLGIVLYVMLNRDLPFNQTVIKALHKAQMTQNWKWKRPYTATEPCKRVLRAMLDPHIETRINIDDLVNCTWFKLDNRFKEMLPPEISAYNNACEIVGRKHVIQPSSTSDQTKLTKTSHTDILLDQNEKSSEPKKLEVTATIDSHPHIHDKICEAGTSKPHRTTKVNPTMSITSLAERAFSCNEITDKDGSDTNPTNISTLKTIPSINDPKYDIETNRELSKDIIRNDDILKNFDVASPRKTNVCQKNAITTVDIEEKNRDLVANPLPHLEDHLLHPGIMIHEQGCESNVTEKNVIVTTPAHKNFSKNISLSNLQLTPEKYYQSAESIQCQNNNSKAFNLSVPSKMNIHEFNTTINAKFQTDTEHKYKSKSETDQVPVKRNASFAKFQLKYMDSLNKEKNIDNINHIQQTKNVKQVEDGRNSSSSEPSTKRSSEISSESSLNIHETHGSATSVTEHTEGCSTVTAKPLSTKISEKKINVYPPDVLPKTKKRNSKHHRKVKKNNKTS